MRVVSPENSDVPVAYCGTHYLCLLLVDLLYLSRGSLELFSAGVMFEFIWSTVGLFPMVTGMMAGCLIGRCFTVVQSLPG